MQAVFTWNTASLGSEAQRRAYASRVGVSRVILDAYGKEWSSLPLSDFGWIRDATLNVMKRNFVGNLPQIVDSRGNPLGEPLRIGQKISVKRPRRFK